MKKTAFIYLAMLIAFTMYSETIHAQDKRDCKKSFLLKGMGNDGDQKEIRVTVTKRFYDFSEEGLQRQNAEDKGRYRGYDYIKIAGPSGDPSQKQDCAGYVFDKLWGVGKYWMTGPVFYETVIKNFGTKISNAVTWGSVQPGDVVIYIDKGGTANHITIVTAVSTFLGVTTTVLIDTKDGVQGVFKHNLPSFTTRFEYEPLQSSWGTPTVFRVNAANVHLSELNNGECDVLGKNVQVLVLDEQNNTPVHHAKVSINEMSGNEVAKSGTNAAGEANITVPVNQLNNPLRVIASASNYEEKWSDLPSAMLQTAHETVVYTVYLKKKSTNTNPPSKGIEKYFTTVNVNLSQWFSTGVFLKKGTHYRVEASGYLFNKNAGTNVPKEVYPDGYGHWNWYVLAAKIGKDSKELTYVGSKGDGYAKEDGILYLGAPRSQNIFPGDSEGTTGYWSVKIYATDGDLR